MILSPPKTFVGIKLIPTIKMKTISEIMLPHIARQRGPATFHTVWQRAGTPEEQAQAYEDFINELQYAAAAGVCHTMNLQGMASPKGLAVIMTVIVPGEDDLFMTTVDIGCAELLDGGNEPCAPEDFKSNPTPLCQAIAARIGQSTDYLLGAEGSAHIMREHIEHLKSIMDEDDLLPPEEWAESVSAATTGRKLHSGTELNKLMDSK